jgi:hypothetical protein
MAGADRAIFGDAARRRSTRALKWTKATGAQSSCQVQFVQIPAKTKSGRRLPVANHRSCPENDVKGTRSVVEA